MSQDEATRAAEVRPLQFDAAEPMSGGADTATAVTCGACATTITTHYYQVNGIITCAKCRHAAEQSLRSGSRGGRIGRALGLGVLAAIAGAGVYYAILAATGYEIGLVSIAVGWMVGRAVNRGSNGRGGRAYQLLAVGLTYAAIVSTYIPFIVKEFRDNPPVAAAADSTGATAGEAMGTGGAEPTLAQAAPAAPAGEASADVAAAVAATDDAAEQERSLGAFLVAVLVLFAIAAVSPVLAGLGNILGMLIIGFALFEAWRINRRATLEVSGPYRVGGEGTTPAASGG